MVEGTRVAGAGAGERGARDLVLHVILRHQHAGDGHLAAADMGVRVDGAGHDDAALHVVVVVDARVRPGRDDPAVLDIDVAHLAAHPVGGVVDFAAGQLDQHGVGDSGLRGPLRWPRARRRRAADRRGRDS